MEHIEISLKSNDDVNACFKMLINSIVKDKSKEDLIKLYGNKDNYNICKEEENKLEKKKYSKSDKCIFFWDKYIIFIFFIYSLL